MVALTYAPGFDPGNAIPTATPAQIAAMNAGIVAAGFLDAASLAALESKLQLGDLSFAYNSFAADDFSPDTPDDPQFRAASALSDLRSLARLYDVATGTVTLDRGSDGVTVVAKSDLLEGPVFLPDGTAYAVIKGLPGSGTPYYVLWWQTPSYVPNPGLDQFVRPNECDQAPGKGTWYRVGAAGGSCPPPPVGWNQGFGLISPRALGSIMLGSEYMKPEPAPVNPHVNTVPAPTVVTPLIGPTTVVSPVAPVLLAPPTATGVAPSATVQEAPTPMAAPVVPAAAAKQSGWIVGALIAASLVLLAIVMNRKGS